MTHQNAAVVVVPVVVEVVVVAVADLEDAVEADHEAVEAEEVADAAEVPRVVADRSSIPLVYPSLSCSIAVVFCVHIVLMYCADSVQILNLAFQNLS